MNKCQFYTTNYTYILQGLPKIPSSEVVVEPFVGYGDLLNILDINQTVEAYDIDPQGFPKIQKMGYTATIKDTLAEPPDYINKYVLTNPPFLAQNKSKDKTYYQIYNQNDLYKCFLQCIINQPVKGGIIIIPLNFWSSIDCLDIRRAFLKLYAVQRLNIFEEQVFPDTSYTICSFFFIRHDENTREIPTYIFPKGDGILLTFGQQNNWTLAGELYAIPLSKYKITRLREGQTPNTCMFLKCIDDKQAINLQISEQIYYGKSTDRSYATLHIVPVIDLTIQQYVCQEFNRILNIYRQSYHSLFLTNYRESSNGKGRKRISFDMAYALVSYILNS